MDNSRTYSKGINSLYSLKQVRGRRGRRKKRKKNYCAFQCTNVQAQAETWMTPEREVYQGKIPGSDLKFGLLPTHWSYHAKCPEALTKHTCQRAENSSTPEDWINPSENLNTNEVKTQKKKRAQTECKNSYNKRHIHGVISPMVLNKQANYSSIQE